MNPFAPNRPWGGSPVRVERDVGRASRARLDPLAGRLGQHSSVAVLESSFAASKGACGRSVATVVARRYGNHRRIPPLA
jgi:hypothetical protein